ncbi:hypothetical protein [Nitrosomonas ureae]|uniref:Uncharacterized protein n=1 Tax=Nitrosomonas ureae TaxID=44577 RepID=A0A2T5ISV9_9PROT|nr:hypothetical protein [Nitrosomonas ureae]PTQ86919.1 hypothetical protein C8R28_1008114 [Nitrosomonas ureae]
MIKKLRNLLIDLFVSPTDSYRQRYKDYLMSVSADDSDRGKDWL